MSRRTQSLTGQDFFRGLFGYKFDKDFRRILVIDHTRRHHEFYYITFSAVESVTDLIDQCELVRL